MSEEARKNIWNFVQPQKFVLPAEPASRKARSFFQRLFSGIRSEESEIGHEAVQSELKNAPGTLIDWLAPFPSWSHTATAIEETLSPWLEDEMPDGNSMVMVAPYGGGLGAMLAFLAEKKKWRVLTAPDYEVLQSRDFSWLTDLPLKSDVPVVIPRLEAFFLRHFNGLEHLRKFVEKMFNANSRYVIGCNSWLWHYVVSAMHIQDSFGRVLYLQSLQAPDLQHLFCGLESQQNHRPTVFRQADNGSFVLPPETTGKGRVEATDNAAGAKGDFPSSFLKKLALESRGIPLVAWAIWRNSLRLAPDEDVAEIAREVADNDVVAKAKAKTIWVKAFEDIELPRVPEGGGQAAAFLLLFLLQHDGLRTETIFELLDLGRDQLISLLNRLQKAGIVVLENNVWRASWQGYPATRRFLAEQDHLQDAM